MKRTITGLMSALLLLPALAAHAQIQDKERAAAAAAEPWLGLLDAGNYAASWREGAGYFRNAVSQGQWEQSLQAVRKPLGKPVSRQLKRTTFRTAMPGAPDGEYVIIQFDTSFENKKKSVETVTCMRDKDGAWRVSGYFIK